MDSVSRLIDIALEEDIGPGDITTACLVGEDVSGHGEMVAKEPFVLAGLDIAKRTFLRLDPETEFQSEYADGDRVETGCVALRVEGKLDALLKGERTALNFLQRLSGIATLVRSYAETLENRKTRLVDTRKTTPGLRVLEKYAVRIGGARNHRMGLFDGVLIKDNHIAVCGGVARAVELARRNIHHLVKIEVEAATLDEVKEALVAGADVIMLDNMDLNRIQKAVAMINGRALVEVSGGVTKESLLRLADTGVDLISSGALTHSAKCVDISMKIKTGK